MPALRCPCSVLVPLALVALSGCAGERGTAPVVELSPHAETPPEERWSDSDVVNEQGDVAVIPAAPALSAALGLYERGDHLGAALAFHDVAGDPGKGSSVTQMAWFFVAKSLARGGFDLAALTVFDAISQEPTHPYWARTLPWVGRLSFPLPEAEWPTRIAGRYGSGQKSDLGAAQSDAIRAQIMYLMGRDSYARGAFAEADERLGRVSPKARVYLKARFFEGVSWVRQKKLGAAVRCFQAILDATDHGRASQLPADEVQRLRDLAWLTLARLDYEQGTDDTPAPLYRALSEYNRVSPYADQKDEVRVELSWTRLRLHEDRAALADFEALPAGFLEERAEAYGVKGAAHLYQCEVDLAHEAIVTAGNIVTRRIAELTALTKGASDQALFALAEQAHAGKLGTAVAGGALVVAAVKDRDFVRMFELIGVIDAEQERIKSAPRGLGASALGGWLLEDLRIERTRVSERIGAAIRGRAERGIKGDREEGERVEALKHDLEAVKSGAVVCVPRKRRGKP
jgi:hypothetical protein